MDLEKAAAVADHAAHGDGFVLIVGIGVGIAVRRSSTHDLDSEEGIDWRDRDWQRAMSLG